MHLPLFKNNKSKALKEDNKLIILSKNQQTNTKKKNQILNN